MAEKKIVIEGPSEVTKKVNAKVITVAVGITFILITTILISYYSNTPKVRQRPVDMDASIGIDFGNIQEADWATKMQTSMGRLVNEMDRISRDNETILKEQTARAREITELKALIESQQARVATLSERAASGTQITGDEGSGAVIDTGGSVEPPARPGSAVPPPRRRGEEQESGEGASRTPAPPRPPRDAVGQRPPMPPPGRAEPSEAVVVEGAAMGSFSAQARRKFVENEFAGYLPAGSFADAVLLHGIDAGASEGTRSNPQPLIMRIDGNAITPGDSEYELDACFAIGNAFGELSSERAVVRVSRISCVDSERGFILEATVDGIVMDSDGMQGLRGTVVRRSGQVMAKALLAGIAEGIGGVAAAAAGTNARQLTGTDFGGGTFGQTTQVDTGGIAAAGAFGGAQNAASIVADFYLREAQSIFPVISIPPGRRVSISFLRGTSLKWENQGGLFREELTPQ